MESKGKTLTSETADKPKLSTEEFLALMEEVSEEMREEEEKRNRGQATLKAAETVEAPETDNSAEAVVNKAKNKTGFKKFIAGVVLGSAILTAGALAFTGLGKNKDKGNMPPQPETRASVDSIESYNPYVGEAEQGIQYDYSHYADYDHKETQWAYDYDMSDSYGNREATEAHIMEVASRTPEALTSYAWNLFTDKEKQELGIAGKSMTEIDEYMSNETNPDAGAMQKRLLEKLEQVLSSDSTSFEFYYENDTEQSNYIYFVDENNDGIMTPDEMVLAYSTRERNKAPQVDVYRQITDANGGVEWVKKLDLNMQCGLQPNYELDNVPADLPHIQTYEAQLETQPETEPTTQPETQPETSTTSTVKSYSLEPTPIVNTPDTPIYTYTPDTPIYTYTPDTPKSYDNTQRIDDQIANDIAQNVGTAEVVVTPAPEVSPTNLTEQPSGNVYEGTAPTIVESQASEPAVPVQEQVVAPANDYSENLGAANANEYAPVQEDQAAQAAADQAETPIEQAPGVESLGSPEMDDILADLGIY